MESMDWIIRGGALLDGLGGSPIWAAVGGAGNRIAATGGFSNAEVGNLFAADG